MRHRCRHVALCAPRLAAGVLIAATSLGTDARAADARDTAGAPWRVFSAGADGVPSGSWRWRPALAVAAGPARQGGSALQLGPAASLGRGGTAVLSLVPRPGRGFVLTLQLPL